MSDWQWRISSSDWSASSVENPLTTDEILDVLDKVPDHYAGALASLADTVLPCEVG